MSALGRRRPAICSRFTARATSLNCSSQLTATSTPTAAYYLATSSIASIFPYATTTSISSSQGAWFATSGGNVGIGTTGPNTKLEVSGVNPFSGTSNPSSALTQGNASLITTTAFGTDVGPLLLFSGNYGTGL